MQTIQKEIEATKISASHFLEKYCKNLKTEIEQYITENEEKISNLLNQYQGKLNKEEVVLLEMSLKNISLITPPPFLLQGVKDNKIQKSIAFNAELYRIHILMNKAILKYQWSELLIFKQLPCSSIQEKKYVDTLNSLMEYFDSGRDFDSLYQLEVSLANKIKA